MRGSRRRTVVAKKTDKPEEGFEELLEATEGIVDTLEGGGLGLEESLKLYEKGVENLRRCAKQLDTAEEKVKILVEKTKGAFALEDFAAEDDDAEE